MSTSGLRRSTRNATQRPPPEQTATAEIEENPPPAPLFEGDRHQAEVGDRYKVPRSEFFDDGDPGELFLGVVTQRVRGYVRIWFTGDDRATQYRGRLEEWSEYYIDPDDYQAADESAFQAVEVRAGVRTAPRPRPERQNRQRPVQADTDSDEDGSESGEEEDVRDVRTWESDPEDDESREEPDVHEEDEQQSCSGDRELAALKWEDIGELTTDPRSSTSSMPEDIRPAFHLPNYRDDN